MHSAGRTPQLKGIRAHPEVCVWGDQSVPIW